MFDLLVLTFEVCCGVWKTLVHTCKRTNVIKDKCGPNICMKVAFISGET